MNLLLLTQTVLIQQKWKVCHIKKAKTSSSWKRKRKHNEMLWTKFTEDISIKVWLNRKPQALDFVSP